MFSKPLLSCYYVPASARALTVTRRYGDQNRARWARDLVEPSVWLGGRRRRGPRAISCDGATQDRRAVPPAVPATQPSARKWPEATLLARPAPSSSEDQRKAGLSGAERGHPCPGLGRRSAPVEWSASRPRRPMRTVQAGHRPGCPPSFFRPVNQRKRQQRHFRAQLISQAFN